MTIGIGPVGYVAGWGFTDGMDAAFGWGMGIDGQSRSFEVMVISRSDSLGDIADLGLTLAESKLLLAQVQQQLVAEQANTHATFRPNCGSCGGTCQVKDWQPHRIATLFGEVRLKLPRFLCAVCGCGETGVGWPSHCRSSPELNQLQARLSALMPFRVAADVLRHLLPIDAGTSPETLRSHTLQVGKQLADAAEKPPAAAAAITISLDSTFIRSREEGERHLEVRVGNVETDTGGRQVFGAVTRADTDITSLIQRTLKAVGRTDTTEVTAFTDGCPGLRTVLTNAGVTKPPILDWFHIAMRLQHTKLAAANLSADDPDRAIAKTTIVAEVERLHWRIWNGKAKNAQRSINRIRKVMHVFKGERSQGAKGVVSRKLWHALHAIDKYLRGQAAWLVNYAKRYRAGERVGTSITEGTANFLVNRRMNKSQQMRWSRKGADLLLQVRCAVYNGTLGAGLGHRFDRISNADLAFAKAV
jgi:hypothetical protein